MLSHYMSHYSNCTSRHCISWWCTSHSGRISSKDNPAKATSDEQCVASHHAEKTRTHSNNAQCSPRNCVRTTNRPALELAGSKLTPSHPWTDGLGTSVLVYLRARSLRSHWLRQITLVPRVRLDQPAWRQRENAWNLCPCISFPPPAVPATESDWNRYESNSAWTTHYHRLLGGLDGPLILAHREEEKTAVFMCAQPMRWLIHKNVGGYIPFSSQTRLSVTGKRNNISTQCIFFSLKLNQWLMDTHKWNNSHSQR